MQTFNKLLLAAATSLAVMLALPMNAFAEETLKMGIEGTHPPFNNQDSSGQVVGFDVEIGNALCAKMKVTCEIVTSDADNIIPALNERKFDFIISSMSITEERQQAVDFTNPYYSNKLQLLAPKSTDLGADNAAIRESLRGKTVGAQRGTLAATWLLDNWGSEMTIKLYDSQESAFQDLASDEQPAKPTEAVLQESPGGESAQPGEAPAVQPPQRPVALLGDKYTSYEWLKSEAGLNFEFKGDPVFDNDKIGIAVRKDDPLREKLNTALKEIITDGTYKKINDKYFPFSIL